MSIIQARSALVDAETAQIIVPEKGLVRITGTFKDQTDTVIPLAAWVSLVLTLYDRDTAAKAIINLVTAVDIKNTGRMALHATDGTFILTLEGADHTIIDTAKDLEWHRALLEGVYATSKPFKYEIDFAVRNLNKVS